MEEKHEPIQVHALLLAVRRAPECCALLALRRVSDRANQMIDLNRARNGSRVGRGIPLAVLGETYGLVTILERVEPDIRGNGIPARYQCRCLRCNVIFVAKGSDVVHRRIRLCCQLPQRS